MKKLTVFGAVVALFTMSALMTSCSSSSDEPVTPAAKVTGISAEMFSVYATSNVAAEFKINVEANTVKDADGKGVGFVYIDRSTKQVMVTATVSSDEYINKEQVAFVNLSAKAPSANIEFTFVKKSEETMTQAEVKETLATEDVVMGTMIPETATDAYVTIAEGTTISGEVDPNEPFSVTAYKPAPAIVSPDELKPGAVIENEEPLVVLECTPSGAKFDKPVKLSVGVGKELAGQTLEIENGNEKVSGKVNAEGMAEFEVTHFSKWELIVNATIVSTEEGSVNILNEPNYEVKAGENLYVYVANTGVDFEFTNLFGLIVQNTLGNTSGKVSGGGTFKVDRDGVVNLKVDQKYTKVTMKVCNVLFSATKWGAVVPTIVTKGGDIHSGGSGN